ncbi:MAG: FecR domain-containing protein [Deltaproteobacteria bacterium]|nr:FecR domain-containing protein [Deltaproteobacteria bacterium]
MSTACDSTLDELDLLVAGNPDAIARHADHLASCDDCRDARHEATTLAALVREAGADHAPLTDLVDRVLAAADREGAAKAVEVSPPQNAANVVEATPPKAAAPTRVEAAPAPLATADPVAAIAQPIAASPAKTATPRVEADTKVVDIASKRPSRTLVAAAAFAAVAAAGVGIYAFTQRPGATAQTNPTVAADGSIGKLERVERAAKDGADGVTVHVDGAARPLRAGETLPAGAEIQTDDRTRASLVLVDGTRLVLDHATRVAFDAGEARRMRITAGRLVADVAHVEKRPASIATPTGKIDVVGTRFAVTATDTLTTVQVVRGAIVLHATKSGSRQDVRAGEEGLIDDGVLTVSAAPGISREVEWSELNPPAAAHDTTSAGLGQLRAYKPGEKRDRDWNLALANHEVKVRISGPIARTEITETFRNDASETLEGVYQFPLPADAQIDSLSLDVEGGFEDGAFIDKERAAKIWRGVIDKATPKVVKRRPEEDLIWVQGPWRDPALLDWKRGGRFELRIFPIPGKGSRTIKIAYTQVVTPRGPWRQYVYPLAHSKDGSTVADKFSVDIEVRGAAPGRVRAAGYQLSADATQQGVEALTMSQSAFVPRGDLVIDYRAADGDAEVRAWTYAGGAAVAPDEKLAAKKQVGNDPKVIEAQRAVAGDVRPTAVLALRPKLPRWDQAKPRDYLIVVDTSQSMAGERLTRAGELTRELIGEMDRRDQFSVMACDSECRRFDGGMRTPSTIAAAEARTWLGTQTAAGASDVVGAIRAASGDFTKGTDRERWVVYVGDGFATTGFRRIGDVEKAIASTTGSEIRVTTVGIGSDADSSLLSAVARGGGGSYLAWVPGQSVHAAAIAGLESTYGTALRDVKLELPAGLSDVAPSVLPTVRAGEEILVAARVTGDVAGDIVIRGTVAGQPYEQRYPVKLAVSSAAGNGFVPRLWASLAIDQLERGGRGEDRARIVALSQGYGVMSRETSLLVLESAAMFEAFGVDRSVQAAKWTGEEALEETTARGAIDYADDKLAKSEAAPGMAGAGRAAPSPKMPMSADAAMDEGGGGGGMIMEPARDIRSRRPGMIAMRRVWFRVPSVTPYDRVSPSIEKAIDAADTALAASPDSREKHRSLVQALSYAGEIERARDVANRWLERDKLDPQALGYQADLLGREGQRDLALRTLSGLVDLDADRVVLHERMVRAYENAGRLAQACSHRIAIASIQLADVKAAGTAARCLRGIGRDRDAELVLRGLPSDADRTAAEKAATVAAIPARTGGDLVVGARWDTGADLDVSLIAPDGSRVSWMGGRKDVVVTDATSSEREQIAVRSLKRGNYLLEVTRNGNATGAVRGSLDISVLGTKRTLPFELLDGRAIVGRVAITMDSRLERVFR